MSSHQSAPSAGRRTRWVLAVLVAVAVVVCALAFRSLDDSSSSVTAPIVSEPERHPSQHGRRGGRLGDIPGPPPGERGGSLGTADGEVPDGATVFDDDVPAVANLDPALLGALREAATDAAGEGVELVVNSGWRSPAYQQHLLDEAVAEYGSEAEATRWVSTPDTSAHVSGDAVDIGPSEAAAWLSGQGAAYGLCQIYDNEPWHYELRPDAVDDGCPDRYDDPTEDPRMQ